MSPSWRQLLRPLIPNIEVRIQHVEPTKRLAVRCREHLGLILRGTRAYEPQYVDALRTLVKQSATVFDVGANIGFYSVLFSKWVGQDGRVIAYEPDPTNIKLLRRNLALNCCDNVIVRPVALTKTSGIEKFSVDSVTRMTGHLGNGATYGGSVVGNGEEEFISVSTSTLDDEVKQFGVPDLLKMDIEGGEYNALAGGAALLQMNRPIIVSEMNSWPDRSESQTSKASQAARLLKESGYDLWNMDSGGEARVDAPPWMVLALPKARSMSIDAP